MIQCRVCGDEEQGEPHEGRGGRPECSALAHLLASFSSTPGEASADHILLAVRVTRTHEIVEVAVPVITLPKDLTPGPSRSQE